MRRGEKARLMMRPEYGYASKDCRVPPPQGGSRDAEYIYDMHLINWVSQLLRMVGPCHAVTMDLH